MSRQLYFPAALFQGKKIHTAPPQSHFPAQSLAVAPLTLVSNKLHDTEFFLRS